MWNLGSVMEEWNKEIKKGMRKWMGDFQRY